MNMNKVESRTLDNTRYTYVSTEKETTIHEDLIVKGTLDLPELHVNQCLRITTGSELNIRSDLFVNGYIYIQYGGVLNVGGDLTSLAGVKMSDNTSVNVYGKADVSNIGCRYKCSFKVGKDLSVTSMRFSDLGCLMVDGSIINKDSTSNNTSMTFANKCRIHIGKDIHCKGSLITSRDCNTIIGGNAFIHSMLLGAWGVTKIYGNLQTDSISCSTCNVYVSGDTNTKKLEQIYDSKFETSNLIASSISLFNNSELKVRDKIHSKVNMRLSLKSTVTTKLMELMDLRMSENSILKAETLSGTIVTISGSFMSLTNLYIHDNISVNWDGRVEVANDLLALGSIALITKTILEVAGNVRAMGLEMGCDSKLNVSKGLYITDLPTSSLKKLHEFKRDNKSNVITGATIGYGNTINVGQDAFISKSLGMGYKSTFNVSGDLTAAGSIVFNEEKKQPGGIVKGRPSRASEILIKVDKDLHIGHHDGEYNLSMYGEIDVAGKVTYDTNNIYLGEFISSLKKQGVLRVRNE